MINDALLNWFIPGGAFVGEGNRLHIHPPFGWRRDILEIHRRPPSMNDNKIRSNWHGFHEQKKSWQEEIEVLLASVRFPRGNLRALCGAFVQLERAFSKIDPGNYRGLVDKATGDALVNYSAIPDDDDEHYFFGGIEFLDPVKRDPRTFLHIYTQPAPGRPAWFPPQSPSPQ